MSCSEEREDFDLSELRDAFAALLDGDEKMALLLFGRLLSEREMAVLRQLLRARGLA